MHVRACRPHVCPVSLCRFVSWVRKGSTSSARSTPQQVSCCNRPSHLTSPRSGTAYTHVTSDSSRWGDERHACDLASSCPATQPRDSFPWLVYAPARLGPCHMEPGASFLCPTCHLQFWILTFCSAGHFCMRMGHVSTCICLGFTCARLCIDM